MVAFASRSTAQNYFTITSKSEHQSMWGIFEYCVVAAVLSRKSRGFAREDTRLYRDAINFRRKRWNAACGVNCLKVSRSLGKKEFFTIVFSWANGSAMQTVPAGLSSEATVGPAM